MPVVADFDLLNELSTGVPRFTKPAVSCQYCRARQLECFIFEGQTACSPCSVFFRECSFASPVARNSSAAYLLDALHPVSEDVCQHTGAMTDHRALFSQGANLNEITDDPLMRQPERSRTRFSTPFQCTFCTDTFKSKYAWTRHEKSLHLSLERWICASHGLIIPSGGPVQTDVQCVFCQEVNPHETHVKSHNYAACGEKGLDARTFYRKDHLREHLRLVHNVALLPSMISWSCASTFIRSRCGFCPAQTSTSWQERKDHLTKHSREGAHMAQWQGNCGFDAEIAAVVTNAMPPYLIAVEARTVSPFSADKGYVFLEELSKLLQEFVVEETERAVAVTHESLRRQARQVLYASTDEWDFGWVDNFDWLTSFKQAHGLP